MTPYTRKMLRIEVAVKILLASCAVFMLSFLLILVGYLSFRGLFIRKEIESPVLPDYQLDFPWPDPEIIKTLPKRQNKGQKEGQTSMNLWLSGEMDIGKLRADQLHAIIIGKERNWVQLAESGEKLTMLLTSQQLESLKQTNARANIDWHQSRYIQVENNYTAVAAALLQRPGSLAILPSSWDWKNWQESQQKENDKLKSHKLPRRLTLATSSVLINPQSLELPNPTGQSYRLPLKTIKTLLHTQSSVHMTTYNWLTGQFSPKISDNFDSSLENYHPVQLQYREYDFLKIDFLLKPPAKNGKIGGISTMLFSSLILIFNSLLLAIPLGLALAIFLKEYAQTGARTQSTKKWQYRFTNMVNIAIQTLSGIPSIIFGLFGSIMFVPFFGIGIISGSATLVLMLLPTIILTSKEALLTVPDSYIEASLALGAQKWYTILHISLPSALPGILAGIILAIGRALGETAALIYTLGTGYQAMLSRFPQLLQDWPALWQDFWIAPSLAKIVQIAQTYPLLDINSSLRSISLHLYWMTVNGISLQKGFSTAFILIILIVLLNIGSRSLLTYFSHKHQGY